MEDFIGRGDRTLGKVLRRAWELGAGMDSWYDNLDKAFTAWEDAIAQADLDWKYRQIENGEWNVFQKEEQSGEFLTPDSRLATPHSFDAPLPWDHIDTGIDKKWLKEDLERALAAAIVPDCSFEGCSHCGVCGTDFGHNIVIEPPAVPKFAGEFVPNTTRTQRIRVWFGKQGNMALVSHLDLIRLFDRVVRRAGLPIAFTGGFHPMPRISLATALALGATSSGEIADFELTMPVPVDTFQEKLAKEMPIDIPIYYVAQIDVKAKAASQLLEAAEYLMTVAAANEVTPAQWQNWIDSIKAKDELWYEQTTKSGKSQLINLRDRLFELELVETDKNRAECISVIRYLGSYRQDGWLLRPEQIVFMLEAVANVEFQILHIHRNRLVLGV
ncbi:TIGR03936 family radical SAM-associated protein [Nostoc linckia]